MKQSKENNGARLAEINAKEVRDSKRNLSVIVTAASTLAEQMRYLSSNLSEQYEDGDRRAEALESAILNIDSAITALEALQAYEAETIKFCKEE